MENNIEIQPLEIGFGIVNKETGIVYDVCETIEEAQVSKDKLLETLCGK